MSSSTAERRDRAGNGGPLANRFARRIAAGSRLFAADKAGDVAVMFGLMAIAMFGLVGAAVDYGRWLTARNDTAMAIDAAVLAGGRMLQTGGSETDAKNAALRVYNQNVADRPGVDGTLTFVASNGGTEFTAQGDLWMRTPFLSFIGTDEMPLFNTTGSEYSKAKLAVGGNAETNLEISLMLDVSGSMSGTKFSDMKTAAKDLVEIIVWADQSEYTSKVAIAPFSADVNLPLTLYNAVRDPAMSATVYGPNVCTTNKGKTTCVTGTAFTRKSPCVVERKGTDKYTDAAVGAGKYIMPLYGKSGGGCSTPSSSAVVPLTSNKATLISKINGLSLGGGTAGHLGTAWAWYLISPNWGSVLGGSSVPASYTSTNTKKIAILMTDGEYNRQYSAFGIESGTSGAPTPTGQVNGSSVNQARALCDGMKAPGKDITVYTVGFDLGGNATAISTLSYCATSPAHAYLAEDGAELKEAFRAIALKISSLYLSR